MAVKLSQEPSPAFDLPSKDCWVVKVGGSLLNHPQLTKRLRKVVRRVSPKPLLVVGGGPVADAVRQWDQTHPLSASAAHGLAIRAMDFNRHLIETLLPEAAAVADPHSAAAVWEQEGIAVLKVRDWLRAEEDHAETLPHSWDVTSDSIAAWAAIRWRAAGLLLLKSVDLPPHSPEGRSAGEPAFVDRYFSQFASRLPRIAWCNLASPGGEIVDWK